MAIFAENTDYEPKHLERYNLWYREPYSSEEELPSDDEEPNFHAKKQR